MLLINFHSVQLAYKSLNTSYVKFSRHWNPAIMGYGTYGFMTFLGPSSRFIGKTIVTLGTRRGNCGSLKGERMPKQFDKDDFTSRWKTIQDLCSVIACHSAFEDCMDGDSIGLGRRHFIIDIIYLLLLTLLKRIVGR